MRRDVTSIYELRSFATGAAITEQLSRSDGEIAYQGGVTFKPVTDGAPYVAYGTGVYYNLL